MKYLILASCTWAFSFGLIKTNLTTLDPNFVAFCRMFFALPLFLPFLKMNILPSKERMKLILLGAIQYGLMYVLCIQAYQYLKAYQVALFTTMTPIYVVLISDLFIKKFRFFYLFTAGFAVFGASLLFTQPNESTRNLLIGFFLVQCADMCFAFGQVFYKHFRQVNSSIQDRFIYAYLFIGAVILTALATTVSHGWESIAQVNQTQWITLVYLGTIASGISFFWWNKGAVLTHSGTLAILNNLKIPLGVLVSLVIFGEKADVFRLTLSCTLIGFAIFLSEKYTARLNNRT